MYLQHLIKFLFKFFFSMNSMPHVFNIRVLQHLNLYKNKITCIQMYFPNNSIHLPPTKVIMKRLTIECIAIFFHVCPCNEFAKKQDKVNIIIICFICPLLATIHVTYPMSRLNANLKRAYSQCRNACQTLNKSNRWSTLF